jgi:hypothetical protein
MAMKPSKLTIQSSVIVRNVLVKSLLVLLTLFATFSNAETLRYHTVVLDSQNKLLPWYTPTENAYDHYLHQLWTWLPTVPNGPSSSLPMYYLYCGFRPGNPITPDNYENDWGERIPVFVEFGRLYYAYTGNMGPLNIAKNLADYALAHGMTPANYAWPNFPYTAANGGATEINGDNVAWNQNEILIDHGSEIGMSFYRLYLVYGTPTYRTAAIKVADTLAAKIQPGSSTNSPWPYVVNASTGAVRSRYTSNFAGALTLFDLLIEHGEPNAAAYTTARQTLKNWILQYPMQNGNWVDGHSDVFIDGNTNWSNTTKSNMNLYLLDNPDFDPNFMNDVPKLLQWTENNMVNINTSDGLRGQYYGASVVAEQFAYMMRMGYQTSRQAAEYAGWYAVTGDETYKDKAYRGFNYSTYMMQSNGQSSDGPTNNVGYWWSDVYGEGPMMFFYGFKAVPEWAPPSENHILYSLSVLRTVSYSTGRVQYTPTNSAGIEYLRLAFIPTDITVNGVSLPLRFDLNTAGYTLRDLGNGDYAVNIRRASDGTVIVSNNDVPISFPPTVAMAAKADPNPVTGATTSLSVLGSDDGGEGNLTYTWTTTGTPPATVNFSGNGTNNAKNTIATFAKAGIYTFQVIIRDQVNFTVTSNTTVTVNQSLISVTVSPAGTSVNTGATQLFTASTQDQFGSPFSTQPQFLWSVSGGGTISSSGLFTAGNTAGGPYTVTASSGGKSGSTTVSVTAASSVGVLGNNVVGTSTDPSGANDLNCWRFRVTSTFIAKNMQINLANQIRGKIKVAIYSDNNGSPGSLLVGSNEITNPSSGWIPFTLTTSQPLTSGAYYWLAAWSNVNYTPRSQATGGTARYITRTYGAWPNSLAGTLGPYTTNDSIFAY